MASQAGIAERLGGLRAAFSGSVLEPDDPGYEDARRVHNGLIDRRPALVARCQNTADVADAGPSVLRAAKGSRSVSAAAATTWPAVRSPTAR